jgi:hypothetical protein
MIKTIVNRVRVSNDATVRMHSDSSSHASSNIGRRSTLRAYYSRPSGTSVRNRIFVSLPRLPGEVQLSDLEAATLEMRISPKLSTGEQWNPMTLVVRRVLSPWDENGITWITTPEVEPRKEIGKVKPPQSGKFQIDVMQVYLDGIDPSFGVRLALDSDESGDAYATEMIEVHSSEAYDTLGGPAVILQYTH